MTSGYEFYCWKILNCLGKNEHSECITKKKSGYWYHLPITWTCSLDSWQTSTGYSDKKEKYKQIKSYTKRQEGMGRHYHARCSTTNTIIKFYSFRVCKFVKNSISGTGLSQVKKILRFYRLVNFVHYMQREKSEHKEKRSICYKKNKELRSRKY